MREHFTRVALRKVPGGRWIVIFAFAVGLAIFGLELAESKGLVHALFTGALAALVLTGLLGFAKGQWQGREVEEVGIPGGGHARLAPLARKTLRPLRALEERLYLSLGDLNERMRDLETRLVAVEEERPSSRGKDQPDRPSQRPSE
jgi:hypothetical protein